MATQPISDEFNRPASQSAVASHRVSFDAATYAAAFEDVREGIAGGHFISAEEHFYGHGEPEGRLSDEKYLVAAGLGGVVGSQVISGALNLESSQCSQSGLLSIVGWVDDRADPIESVVALAGGSRVWFSRTVSRIRRTDVDTALNVVASYDFGFWIMLNVDFDFSTSERLEVRFRYRSGKTEQVELQPRMFSEEEFRTAMLGYFSRLQYSGNSDLGSRMVLGTGIGDELVAFNRNITSGFTRNAFAMRFNEGGSEATGSLVVCLYGKPEFLFIQCSLFSRCENAGDLEYIFVSNSPELAEVLVKEAKIAAQIYGLKLTLVILPGNAGFSAANNAAVEAARSPRVIICNPDVFPTRRDWVKAHAALVDRGSDDTKFFGVPLLYGDGSLMHGGMFFEVDSGLSVADTGVTVTPMIRVEHYGKGAPHNSAKYTRARPVPAVTGAFMSIERTLFEKLGGFSVDYLFGHYEDADLCLRSLESGTPVYLQPITFWHLEGKGSTRRAEHEGGSLLNRWLFTKRWLSLIEEGIKGEAPSDPRLNPTEATAELEKQNG